MPAGSVGLDIGCGNGKYLTVNPNVYIIGSDRSVLPSASPVCIAEPLCRSSNLVQIAYDRKLIHESFVADALDLPHPAGRFDFAISIAVIHHFSSPERRVASIKSILSTLKPSSDGGGGGKALIYVWALEQRNSRRGWDEGHSQDVFVPWVLSKQYTTKKGGSGNSSSEPVKSGEADADTQPKEITYQRYYHLYRKGELEADVAAAGGYVLESGYEKDNWWAICSVATGSG
jgi:tRNA (uracil-5-)-methyltransferase TRM9